MKLLPAQRCLRYLQVAQSDCWSVTSWISGERLRTEDERSTTNPIGIIIITTLCQHCPCAAKNKHQCMRNVLVLAVLGRIHVTSLLVDSSVVGEQLFGTEPLAFLW
eukprot:gb/GECG01013776.1/.p1 GENE.gb/GECG01013776.1/~~gb/GECG01013776.1/.p1  ORF type:complete len:106 (+),score=7.21 gb/GECG01013776.1/:1-318(+)